MSSKRSLTHTRLSRSNVNSVVRSYLSPTPVGVGVGTSLIWAVHQTLLPARVWLRETRRRRSYSAVVLASFPGPRRRRGYSAVVLASFPDPRRRRGYSAVVLASFPGPAQLSVAFLYCKRRKAGRGLGTRLQPRETTSAAALSFVLGLPVCVLFALLFQQRGALWSRSILCFLFSSIVCRVLRGLLREQDGAISTTPKLHFENTMVPYQLPLGLRWAVRLPRNSYTCIFKFFTTRVLLFNEYECIYGTTYEYIHTYRHRLRSTR